MVNFVKKICMKHVCCMNYMIIVIVKQSLLAHPRCSPPREIKVLSYRDSLNIAFKLKQHLRPKIWSWISSFYIHIHRKKIFVFQNLNLLYMLWYQNKFWFIREMKKYFVNRIFKIFNTDDSLLLFFFIINHIKQNKKCSIFYNKHAY